MSRVSRVQASKLVSQNTQVPKQACLLACLLPVCVPAPARCLFTGTMVLGRGVPSKYFDLLGGQGQGLVFRVFSQSVSYFTVPPRAHPSTGSLSPAPPLPV